MKDLIKHNLNGAKVLFLFILTSAIYTVMLTITIPKVMGLCGGMKLLDMLPTGYNAGYVRTLFDALGDQGRHAYLYNQIPLDMFYPFLFGISYGLVLAYFLNKLGKLDSRWFYFCLVPLFAGLFDYSENIGIIVLLKSYPHLSPGTVQATNVFSVLKSFLTTAYFIVLIIFISIFGIRKLFRHRQPFQPKGASPHDRPE